MRAAVFTPYFFYPPDTGGKIRSYYLLRALTARFEVDLYTVYYGKRPAEQHVKALQEHCRQVILLHLDKRWRTRDRLWRVLSPLPRLVDLFCTKESLNQARACIHLDQYDVIIADEIPTAPYAELAPELPRIILRQKVDHLHYREVARARPWGLEKVLDLIESIQLYQYERRKMPLFQACVACSSQDVALMSRYAPHVPALVIPNGADLNAFVSSGREKSEHPTLLYVGSMSYYPNIDAVRYFFSDVFEPIRQVIPNIQVQVVGHNPPSEIRELTRLAGVEVTGTVPDVRPYYDRATVFMVPLRLGGGTRLKIVEAMAMGLPVVSTTVGAEGLDVHPGENILIADDAAGFARSVLELLSNSDLYERIAQGGRLLAHRYDWNELTRPYADLVEDVVRRWQEGQR